MSWGCSHLYIELSTSDVIIRETMPNVNRAGEGHSDDGKLKRRQILMSDGLKVWSIYLCSLEIIVCDVCVYS